MPLTLNEVATNDCLKGCVNAYTGEKMEVRVVCTNVGKRPIVFLSPGTPSPASFHEKLEDLLDLAGMRDGVKGLAGEDGTFTCPYNGNRMSLQKVNGSGYRMIGGFDPACPVQSAQMFAHLAKMRGGKADPSAPYPPPPPVVKVLGELEEPEPSHVRTTVSDAAGEAAERIAHAVKKAAGRVTVAQ